MYFVISPIASFFELFLNLFTFRLFFSQISNFRAQRITLKIGLRNTSHEITPPHKLKKLTKFLNADNRTSFKHQVCFTIWSPFCQPEFFRNIPCLFHKQCLIGMMLQAFLSETHQNFKIHSAAKIS